MTSRSRRRAAWIVPSVEAGGIGPAAFEIASASAAAAADGCDVTLIETHAPPRDERLGNGLRRIAFDMGGTRAPARVVLDWLEDNSQDVVFTNGVSHLEEIFPHIPAATMHVAVLHDAARRYRADLLSYAQHLDAVVAVSDYVHGWAQKDLHAAGFPGLLRRIHNGTSFPPPPNRPAPGAALRLLLIGTSVQKGGSQLAGIARALRRRGRHFQVTIVGEEDAWLRRRLTRAGLGDALTWIHRQRREDMWHTYGEHDLLLMLSHGEAFGMVTVEAMGMGCVPLAFDVPSGTREIVEPGVSGLLVRSSCEATAAAIATLSPSRLRSMSAESMRRARTLFSGEGAARDYLQLVDDLLRCRDLIGRSRRAPAAIARAEKGSRHSPVARLYYALPYSLRRQIRHALTNYPTGIRWLRERI